MLRQYIAFLLLIISVLAPARSEGQGISGPGVEIADDDIYVTFSIKLEEKNILEIKQGIDKEFNFYIDLFRIWNIWPNEFVLGKYYSRTVKSDPIKKEYVATSSDGNVIIEKRFRSLESMLGWTLSFRDLKLTNIRELDPGRYFVRVTVESKIRKIPPVIRYIFIFLSENEFRAVKDSANFVIKGVK